MKPKGQKFLLILAAVAVIFVSGAFYNHVEAAKNTDLAASLSTSQIQSILNLLKSFGAEQRVIDNVSTKLYTSTNKTQPDTSKKDSGLNPDTSSLPVEPIEDQPIVIDGTTKYKTTPEDPSPITDPDPKGPIVPIDLPEIASFDVRPYSGDVPLKAEATLTFKSPVGCVMYDLDWERGGLLKRPAPTRIATPMCDGGTNKVTQISSSHTYNAPGRYRPLLTTVAGDKAASFPGTLYFFGPLTEKQINYILDLVEKFGGTSSMIENTKTLLKGGSVSDSEIGSESLNDSQIASIISLLTTFNVSTDTQKRVKDVLSGTKREVPKPYLTIDGYNVEGPEIIHDSQKGNLMYFSGYMTSADSSNGGSNIYVAKNCPGSDVTSKCTDIQKLIDAKDNGFIMLSDPSIVKMSGADGKDYYIMYMTGWERTKYDESSIPATIYYSTSWVGDGINWSKPQKLIEGNNRYPSALHEFGDQGQVILFAERYTNTGSYTSGKVVAYKLGENGVSPSSAIAVMLPDTTPVWGINVEYACERGCYYLMYTSDRGQTIKSYMSDVSSGGFSGNNSWKYYDKDGVALKLASDEKYISTPMAIPTGYRVDGRPFIHYAATHTGGGVLKDFKIYMATYGQKDDRNALSGLTGAVIEGIKGVSNFIGSLFVKKDNAAAALTSDQISSILDLLRSFGAQDNVINNVDNALRGNTGNVQVPADDFQADSNVSQSGSSSATIQPINLNRNLSLGYSGSDVSSLQEFLRNAGDYTYPEITGYYGPTTQSAVQSWQARNGVVSSGTPETTGYGAVGPATRAAMANPTPLPTPVVDKNPNPIIPADEKNTDTEPDVSSLPVEPIKDEPIIIDDTTKDKTTPEDPSPITDPGIVGPIVPVDQAVVDPPRLENLNLSTNTGLVPFTVEITFSAYGDCDTYKIDWGDGSTETSLGGKNPSFACSNLGTPVLGLIDRSHTYTKPGTYKLNVIYSGGTISRDITVKEAPVVEENNKQTVAIDSVNIYSPETVMQDGMMKLYFGGWTESGQKHDNIYVADCANPKAACTNIRKVIDSVANGFNHLNDPSIVKHPDGYYIMYMTGVEEGKDGLVASNNNIYYSTSWLDDGVNWSKPQLLLKSHWLPSVTIKNDVIELYSNDNAVWGGIERHTLGKSGVEVGEPQRVTITNMPSDGYYSNPNVVYRPSLGIYQIFAERDKSDGTSVIDYLTSKDGINWTVENKDIVVPAEGEYRVGTPAPHPDTNSWVYFGSTKQNNSMGFDIRFQDWWHKDTVSTTVSSKLVANALSALERGLSSLEKTFSSLFK